MDHPPDVDYTVVLVFPGFGTERENAETIVESALEWLNTHKDKPGFRFSAQVNAHLVIVQDADEARARIEADDLVALVLLHDLADDERDELVRDCAKRGIAAGITVDVPRPSGRRKEPWKVVVRSKPTNEPPAHQLCAETLTAPVGDDEETGERVGELIAVVALGVMTYDYAKGRR
jgi:hypothetical protein